VGGVNGCIEGCTVGYGKGWVEGRFDGIDVGSCDGIAVG